MTTSQPDHGITTLLHMSESESLVLTACEVALWSNLFRFLAADFVSEYLAGDSVIFVLSRNVVAWWNG